MGFYCHIYIMLILLNCWRQKAAFGRFNDPSLCVCVCMCVENSLLNHIWMWHSLCTLCVCVCVLHPNLHAGRHTHTVEDGCSRFSVMPLNLPSWKWQRANIMQSIQLHTYGHGRAGADWDTQILSLVCTHKTKIRTLCPHHPFFRAPCQIIFSPLFFRKPVMSRPLKFETCLSVFSLCCAV